MEITLPEGATREDLKAFFKFLASGKEAPLPKRKYFCEDCYFWKDFKPGTNTYSPHCGLYSCQCATEMGQRKTPSRYLPREAIEEEDSDA